YLYGPDRLGKARQWHIDSGAREILPVAHDRLRAIEFRDHGNAISEKRRLHLYAVAENTIRYVSKQSNTQPKHRPAKARDRQNIQGPGRAWAGWRRGPRDHPCFGDRKRLLLDRFHIALKEIIIERTVGLRRALELAQLNLRLVRRLRFRNDLVQASPRGILTSLGDLVVALVGLGYPFQFVKDRITDLAHLVAQVDRGQMVAPIAGRVVGFASSVIEVTLAQGRDDRVLQDVGDRRRCSKLFVGSLSAYNLVNAIETGFVLGGLRACLDESSVELSKLLFAHEPAPSPTRVDDVVLRLVVDDCALGCRSLPARLLQTVL